MHATKAIFPGSFDPLTRGHLDIIERSLEIFPQVLVGVLQHGVKAPLFTSEERVALITSDCQKFSGRVIVKSFSGLLVDFAEQEGCRVILRGLRAVSDYDYETQMALMNRKLRSSIETFFLAAREENSYISSSIIKQVVAHGGDVSALVSPSVLLALKSKFQS